MVEALSGGRWQGSSTLTETPPQTSWKEIGRVTTTQAENTINTGSFTAKDNLMVLMFLRGGSAPYAELTFNDSTGNQYAERYSDEGASDGTRTNKALIQLGTGGALNMDTYIILNIANLATQEKLVHMRTVEQNNTGAGNAPERQEVAAKWVNTSQITSIKVHDTRAGHEYNTGSEILVLGCDNDEANSGTNYWQELKNTSAGGSSTTLDSGTFTAKKYLMVETYGTTGSSNMDNIGYRVNSESGSEYARRVSHNGGSDTTSTSQNYIRFGGGSAAANDIFVNTFIINSSSYEKLFINDCNRNRNTGAGNAPDRFENVAKWANTSDQITSIQLINDANNWTTDSYIKVWGGN